MNPCLKICAEETMNEFPEVAWDRFTEKPNGLTLYGWIDREDEHKDFMLIMIDSVGRSILIKFVTSSAKYSEEFSRRSGGTKHIPCQTVRGVFSVRTVARKLSTPQMPNQSL